MRNTRSMIAVVSIAALAMAACQDDDDDETVYDANMNSAAELHTVNGSPTATGTATLTLDEDRNLRVLVAINGQLTSNITMAHIHGPATSSQTAGVVLDFVPRMSGVIAAGTRTGTVVDATYDLDALPVSGTGELRVTADELLAMLNAGTAYVNIHTQTNPAGEIRGQVSRF